MTKPRLESELKGLVYSLTPKQTVIAVWYERPVLLSVIVLACTALLNYLF